MEILDTLRFVQGAVSSKDHVPEMKHFMIEGGRAQAFNGIIAISSPIDFSVDCKPKAAPLVYAIDRCKEVTSLALTPNGRLRIQSGAFKAFIDCLDSEAPSIRPEGEEVALDGKLLLDAAEKLSPFIGKDASRPWVNGILLRGQSAFATNNVCLVEYWLGVDLPFVVNIPMAAIKELIRVKKPPIHAQISEKSITFHYEDGCWIRSQLYETNWPDLTKILNRPSAQAPVPEGLFEALETIKPFADINGKVFFSEDRVFTHEEDELGADYKVEGLHGQGIYRIEMLRLLEGVATTIDFTLYPDPLLFYGERLRGAIIGYRT